jgi:hypothetical protein
MDWKSTVSPTNPRQSSIFFSVRLYLDNLPCFCINYSIKINCIIQIIPNSITFWQIIIGKMPFWKCALRWTIIDICLISDLLFFKKCIFLLDETPPQISDHYHIATYAHFDMTWHDMRWHDMVWQFRFHYNFCHGAWLLWQLKSTENNIKS